MFTCVRKVPSFNGFDYDVEVLLLLSLMLTGIRCTESFSPRFRIETSVYFFVFHQMQVSQMCLCCFFYVWMQFTSSCVQAFIFANKHPRICRYSSLFKTMSIHSYIFNEILLKCRFIVAYSEMSTNIYLLIKSVITALLLAFNLS